MIKVLNSNLISVPKTNIIEININFAPISNDMYDTDKLVASTDISSRTYNKDQIKTKFHTFALNVDNVIAQHDFIIEDSHQSDRNGSVSYYITFYPVDSEGNIRDKYLIFFRLSDHNLKGVSQRSRNYHKTMAKKFKRSDDKFQKFRFENIVIDGKMFKGFSSALDYIYDMLEDMQDGSYFE